MKPNNPLVSIIIPTFNRAHFIGETLDSVLAQTYDNWECIVVDDGSSDNTKEIVNAYVKKDTRFQYFIRPNIHKHGGNGARNYGFKQSKGAFIIWFDSDDLMLPQHIERKVTFLLRHSVDFVVSKTQNFSSKGMELPYEYHFPNGFKQEDFLLRKIHWYTYDLMLSRVIANQISFHEQMTFWQDYYYHCLLLGITQKGLFIDEVLTHRRVHDNSIQKNHTSNPLQFQQALLKAKWITYHGVQNTISKLALKQFWHGIMNGCLSIAKKKGFIPYYFSVIKEVNSIFGIKSLLLFHLALTFGYVLGKGERILEMAKQKN